MIKRREKKSAIALAALLMLNLQACTKQELGGVATVSALLLAVPLVPFAEAYHLINDTDGKNKKAREAWRAQFDPIYAERTAIIQARKPADDALALFNEGTVAFLPTVPGSGYYHGLSSVGAAFKDPENQSVIADNEFLLSMQTLMEDDPLHEETANYRYHSPTYDAFNEASKIYKTAFNQRMSQLSGRHQIEQPKPKA